jgi:O-antigen/teichoic acid export membrane protein
VHVVITFLARSRGYVWGIVDQAFSSLANFGLTLLAGRVLGPEGLGVIVVGMTTYFLVVNAQRALLTTPLVTSSAARKDWARRRAIRRGLTVSLTYGLLATALVLVVGAAVSGHAGRGLLIMAPWLLAALLQDFWRAILFQEQRPAAAALNDGCWALVMVVVAPLAWVIGTDWAIAACWGLGALAGALLGLAQLRVRPLSPILSLTWWRLRLWPFGRWLALEGGVYWGMYATAILVLGTIIGSTGLGGLQAAQSLFAPLSLLLPALALPGLPAMTRRVARSSGAAMVLALQISAVATVLASLYVGVMILLGGSALPYVFGDSFEGYSDLAVPIGALQLATGLAAGMNLFLRAQQRGRDLLWIMVVGAGASTAFSCLFASMTGTTGAAWGFVAGATAGTAMSAALAMRAYRSRREASARLGSEVPS